MGEKLINRRSPEVRESLSFSASQSTLTGYESLRLMYNPYCMSTSICKNMYSDELTITNNDISKSNKDSNDLSAIIGKGKESDENYQSVAEHNIQDCSAKKSEKINTDDDQNLGFTIIPDTQEEPIEMELINTVRDNDLTLVVQETQEIQQNKENQIFDKEISCSKLRKEDNNRRNKLRATCYIKNSMDISSSSVSEEYDMDIEKNCETPIYGDRVTTLDNTISPKLSQNLIENEATPSKQRRISTIVRKPSKILLPNRNHNEINDVAINNINQHELEAEQFTDEHSLRSGILHNTKKVSLTQENLLAELSFRNFLSYSTLKVPDGNSKSRASRIPLRKRFGAKAKSSLKLPTPCKVLELRQSNGPAEPIILSEESIPANIKNKLKNNSKIFVPEQSPVQPVDIRKRKLRKSALLANFKINQLSDLTSSNKNSSERDYIKLYEKYKDECDHYNLELRKESVTSSNLGKENMKNKNVPLVHVFHADADQSFTEILNKQNRKRRISQASSPKPTKTFRQHIRLVKKISKSMPLLQQKSSKKNREEINSMSSSSSTTSRMLNDIQLDLQANPYIYNDPQEVQNFWKKSIEKKAEIVPSLTQYDKIVASIYKEEKKQERKKKSKARNKQNEEYHNQDHDRQENKKKTTNKGARSIKFANHIANETILAEVHPNTQVDSPECVQGVEIQNSNHFAEKQNNKTTRSIKKKILNKYLTPNEEQNSKNCANTSSDITQIVDSLKHSFSKLQIVDSLKHSFSKFEPTILTTVTENINIVQQQNQISVPTKLKTPNNTEISAKLKKKKKLNNDMSIQKESFETEHQEEPQSTDKIIKKTKIINKNNDCADSSVVTIDDNLSKPSDLVANSNFSEAEDFFHWVKQLPQATAGQNNNRNNNNGSSSNSSICNDENDVHRFFADDNFRITDIHKMQLTEIDGVAYIFKEILDMGFIKFNPGSQKPKARSKTYNLHFLFLFGVLEFYIEGELHHSKAGNFISIPKRVNYNIINSSNEVACLFFIKATDFNSRSTYTSHVKSHKKQQQHNQQLQQHDSGFSSNIKTRNHSNRNAVIPTLPSRSSSPSLSTAIAQVSSTGGGSDLYQCNVCQKTFFFLDNLNRHNLKHTGDRPFECEICDKTYSTKRNQQVHRRIHSSDRPYKCDECGKRFLRSSSLNRHIKIHTGERPHKCSFCAKGFIESCKLVEHMRMHTGEKPFKCEFCGKTFSRKWDLQVHRRLHTKDRRYKCDECGKAFQGKYSLNRHMKVHTGKRPFECEFCDKTFSTKRNHQVHRRFHSSDRPYKCDECGKRFLISSSLNRHIKIHTGERPHKCSFCAKGFIESSKLVEHMRMHTGERPFKCEFCGKTFSRKTNLQAHRRVHQRPTIYMQ